MKKKYFETRKNSLEDSVKNIFGKTIETSQRIFDEAKQAAKTAGKKYFVSDGKQHKIDEENEVVAKKDSVVTRKPKNTDPSPKVEDNTNDKSDDGEGLDKVKKDAAKKKFDDRKDKDIDNDGDTDSSDKFLHKKRQAITKSVEKESFGANRPSAPDKYKQYLKKTGGSLSTGRSESKEANKSIVEIQQDKNLSMREMLAKIWGVNEGISPFQPYKEDEAKPKTKKTESGQKTTKVEVNPELAPVVQTQIVPNADR